MMIKAAAELVKIGFDLRFLSSHQYVTGKLEIIAASQLADQKEVFRRNGHPMFKEFFGAVRHHDRLIRDYGSRTRKSGHGKNGSID